MRLPNPSRPLARAQKPQRSGEVARKRLPRRGKRTPSQIRRAFSRFAGTTRFWFDLEGGGARLEDVPAGTRQILGLCSQKSETLFGLFQRLARMLRETYAAPHAEFEKLVWQRGQVRLVSFLNALARTDAERGVVLNFISVMSIKLPM